MRGYEINGKNNLIKIVNENLCGIRHQYTLNTIIRDEINLISFCKDIEMYKFFDKGLYYCNVVIKDNQYIELINNKYKTNEIVLENLFLWKDHELWNNLEFCINACLYNGLNIKYVRLNNEEQEILLNKLNPITFYYDLCNEEIREKMLNKLYNTTTKCHTYNIIMVANKCIKHPLLYKRIKMLLNNKFLRDLDNYLEINANHIFVKKDDENYWSTYEWCVNPYYSNQSYFFDKSITHL